MKHTPKMFSFAKLVAIPQLWINSSQFLLIFFIIAICLNAEDTLFYNQNEGFHCNFIARTVLPWRNHCKWCGVDTRWDKCPINWCLSNTWDTGWSRSEHSANTWERKFNADGFKGDDEKDWFIYQERNRNLQPGQGWRASRHRKDQHRQDH